MHTDGLIVFGKEGYIGSHFCRAFPQALGIGRCQFDLCDPQIDFCTKGMRYALVAAGISNPKRCEEEPLLSYRCNIEGTLKLGDELLKRGITPIFLSSDYVFNDALEIQPLNTYGRQKAELEKEGTKLGALVIRLSKVYSFEKGDGTLFDEMASKLTANNTVYAACDQIFAPIFIGDVIAHVAASLKKNVKGVVSVVGPSYASRLTMAKKLAERLGVEKELVKPILLADLKDGLQRPRLLTLTSSFPSLTWEEGIERVVLNYVKK